MKLIERGGRSMSLRVKPAEYIFGKSAYLYPKNHENPSVFFKNTKTNMKIPPFSGTNTKQNMKILPFSVNNTKQNMKITPFSVKHIKNKSMCFL